ncbi:MAG TPA: sodium-dependent bicarbonate transport family permease, partial [Candidatus Saccharimonadales bacterium]|nr:sodium-dependent bicarbonate transport family permease [Candidatus Saccharimonadales bacterium]
MGIEYIASNLLNPVILFFFLGVLAVLFKSNLEIPQPLPKLFTLYLLFTIGYKGGAELRASGFDDQIILTLLAAVAMSIAVPLYTFFILKRKLSIHNAAAVAATYGSVS